MLALAAICGKAGVDTSYQALTDEVLRQPASEVLAREAAYLARLEEELAVIRTASLPAVIRTASLPSSSASGPGKPSTRASNTSLVETIVKPQASGKWNGWTPTNIVYDESTIGMVTLCVLDWEAYHEDPTKHAMFRQLVDFSCNANTRTVSMAELREDLATDMGSVIPPTGFVFHESRCGSTLSANILGSDSQNLMFAESKPVPAVVSHCATCTEEQRMADLKTIVAQMGRSSTHSRLFFKFQSVMAFQAAFIVKCFPETPWVFLYRDAVEVSVSHVRNFQRGTVRQTRRLRKHGGAGSAAPCLRSRKKPHASILAVAGANASAEDVKTYPDEKYCVLHLAGLCRSVLDAAKAQPVKRAYFLQYTPKFADSFMSLLPDHFSYIPSDSAKVKMLQSAAVYSKGGGFKFVDDSQVGLCHA
jgi:hypothetical protein